MVPSPYGARPTPKLSIELFADGTDTTVAEVVDIVNFSLIAKHLHQIFDDGDDVFFGKDPDLRVDVEVQLAVDAVASHKSEVISFIGEEKLLDDAACGFLIGRVGATEQTIDILHGIFLRVTVSLLRVL
jgi:hypothetical protein